MLHEPLDGGATCIVSTSVGFPAGNVFLGKVATGARKFGPYAAVFTDTIATNTFSPSLIKG